MNVAAEKDVRDLIASKLAYIDLSDDNDGASPQTVGEQLDHIIAMGEGNSQYRAAKETLDMMKEYGVTDCREWIVKEVEDSNARDGFYGCMFDTRDGDCIVAFRGSEGGIDKIFESETAYHDWAEADFGLLVNIETDQQKRAQEFTKSLYDRYGDKYTYDFAGHSLGGNLAEHATITAPKGMPIRRCVNIDGPGFTEEYIARHLGDISRRACVVDHYQATVVGALLNQLPGTNYRSIATTQGEGGGFFGDYFSGHDLANIAKAMNSDGSFQEGSMDPLAVSLKLVSIAADLVVYCPLLSAIWCVAEEIRRELVQFGEAMKTIINQVRKGIQNLISGLKSWFNSMFGASLTGEYYINTSLVSSLSGETADAARKLKSAGERVERVASTIHYNSASGSYYKSKLRRIANNLNRYYQKTLALANATNDCVRCFTQGDARGRACYSGL